MYGIADMEGMLNGLEEEVEKWRVNGGGKSGMMALLRPVEVIMEMT